MKNTQNLREASARSHSSFSQGWVTGGLGKNRKLYAILRKAHRVLGMGSKRLGLGMLGVGAALGVMVLSSGGANAAIQIGEGTVSGSGASATGNLAIAIGSGSSSTATHSLAVGGAAAATGIYSTALGYSSEASGVRSTAITGGKALASYAIAIGENATVSAEGNTGVAIGVNSSTTGGGGVALGAYSTASNTYALAIGSSSVASGLLSTAIGGSAKATGQFSVALGRAADGFSDSSVAVGNYSSAHGLRSIGIGDTAITKEDDSIAIGSGALTGVGAAQAIAIGSGAGAEGPNSIAFGTGAHTNSSNGVAVGAGAYTTASGGVAIGNNATTGNANDVALGAGSASSTAVATKTMIVNGTTYNVAGNAPASTVSVGKSGSERTITNVAAGRVSNTSTDAVNGSQLYAVGQNVTLVSNNASSYFGGGANIAQGVPPTYVIQSSSHNDVGSALGAVDNNLTTINSAINGGGIKYFHANSVLPDSKATGTNSVAIGPNAQANNANDVAIGHGSITALANPTSSITIKGTPYAFAGVNPGSVFSIGSVGNERQLTNVAAGRISATSTDAVNGSQLYAVTSAIDSLTQGGATDALMWDNTILAYTANHNGSGPNKITHVAAGTVSASSTDAINGAQLFAVTGDTSTTYITNNGAGVRYVRTNDTGLPKDDAHASGVGASAVGYNAVASGTNAVAIGRNAVASNDSSIALGANSVTAAANATAGTTIAGMAYTFAGGAPTSVVSIGSVGNERQLTNVAAGRLSAASTDVINGSQLYATNTAVTNLSNTVINGGAGPVQYSNAATPTTPNGGVKTNNVTLVGAVAGTVTMHNVGPGVLSAASTDAVNGSQLYALGSTTSTVIGGGSTFDPTTGKLTNPTINVAGNTYNNVTNAIEAAGAGFNVRNTTTGAGTNIAPNSTLTVLGGNNVTVGQNGSTLTISAADALLWDIGSGSFSASHGSATINKVTNVAAGALSATSTDAINGSQLYATNQNVTNLGDEITNLGDDVTNIYNTGTKYFHANSTGADSMATGADSVAIGTNAKANNANDVALGANSVTAAANATAGATIAGTDYTFAGGAPTSVVSIGSVGNERQLTNVAAGQLSATSTDAVNGSQLFATNTAVNTLNNSVTNLGNDALLWDAGAGAFSASHGSATTNKVTNVSAGTLSATSTDAVNGSQLYATNQNVTNLGDEITNLGDDVTNIFNTGTKYFHANSTGTDSVATGADSVAIGTNAKANNANDVALGSGSVTAAANATTGATIAGTDYTFAGDAPTSVVSIGSAGNERQLTNVAAGQLSATSTDAVNGSQLYATNQALDGLNTGINTLSTDALLWDSTIGAFSANHKGTGPNKITNVAAGTLSTTSTDAVNGSQLYALGDSVTNIIGGNATYNTTTGKIDGAAFSIANNTYNTVTEAFSAVDSSITNLGDEITSIYGTGTKYFHANSTGDDSVATGADSVAIGMNAKANNANDVALGAGSVTAAANATTGATIAGTDYTFAGGAPTSVVSIGSVGDERQLTNVAAGQLSATSTDAVNGSQLYASNLAISDAVTGLAGDALLWNDTLGAFSASHGSATTNKITNVSAGTLSATSTDAVNGSQLYATNQNVTNLGDEITNLGDDVTNIYNTGTKYFHANSTGADSVATGTDSVAIGSVGNERQLTNVAAGQLSATSTDAVNGSQLFATNTAVNTLNNSVTNLGNDALLWDAGAGAFSASHGSATTNKVTNVSAGTLSTTSTDAVNGSQLYATNQNVTNLGDEITNLGDDVTNIFNTGTKYFHANSTGADSVATGADSVATGADSVAIGQSAVATNANDVALGSGSVTAAANAATGATIAGTDYTFAGGAPTSVVSIGSVGNERQLTNVAAGQLSATSTDAVNGSQLYATNQALDGLNTGINTLNTDALLWDSTIGAFSANHKGTGPNKITNVAAGTLSMSSSDAVNGSQLYALGDSVTNIIGGNATYNTTTGKIDGASFSIANNTYNTVTEAFTAVDSSITNLGDEITNLGDDVTNIYNTGTKYFHANSTGDDSVATGADSVAIGMNAKANNANDVALGSGSVTAAANATTGATIAGTDYTFAGGAPTSVVSIGSAGNERQLTNIAAGQLSATSTDAVNGSQLYATNQALDTLNTDVSTLNTDALLWDSTIGAFSANHKGTGPNKITNVAAGTLSAASTEAVNGSQLHALGDIVTNIFGGDAIYNTTTGKVEGASFNLVNNTYHTVSDAFSAVDSSITNLGDDITNIYDTGTKYFHANSTGDDSVATGADSIAIGQSAVATNANDVALGSGSVTAAANATTGATIAGTDYTFAGGAPTSVVSIGSVGNERQLTNVAAGQLSVTSTDAVNGSQLYATNQALDSLNTDISTLSTDALLWDDTLGAFSANHKGTGPNKITNVAGGTLSTTSTDAVNGSQLYALGDSVTNIIGGNATYNTTTGKIDGAAFSIANNTYNTVTEAFTAVDGSITNLTNNITNGSIGPVQRSGTNKLSLIADGGDATDPGDAQVLTNVADGEIAATSKDAINGSQLFALGDSTAKIMGGTATYNTTTGQIDGAAFTVAGNSYDTISDAFNAVNNSIDGGGIKYFHTNSKLADSQAIGTDSVAIGGNASAQGNSSIAQGTNAVAASDNDIAIGTGAQATGGNSVAMGNNANAAGTNASAMGNNATASGNNATAMGSNSVASGENAAAIGNGATASGTDSVAMGSGAKANNSGDVALGAGSVTEAAVSTSKMTVNGTEYDVAGSVANSTVSVGSGIEGDQNAYRTVTNVAAGRVEQNSTDAINGSQLWATNQAITDIGAKADNAVQYDNGDKNKVTFGGAGATTPVQVTNVAAGTISADSTDAVNGSQLYDVKKVADNSVQYGLDANGNKTNTVILQGGDPNAPVVLSNVAAGIADTDAVNVSQLKQSTQNITNYIDQSSSQTLQQANSYTDSRSQQTLQAANAYTDQKFGQLNQDIKAAKTEARQAAAIGLAAASLRYDDRPGKWSTAVGGGAWRGQGAFAMGLGYTSEDGGIRANVSAATTGNNWGIGAGLSITLN